MDLDIDFDFDFLDSTEFAQYLTLTSLVYFLTMFGWVGLLCSQKGFGSAASSIFGIVSGFAFVFLMNGMMAILYKLEENNITATGDSIGKTGHVYLKIPKERSGCGIINVSINNSTREFQAMTDSQSDIATGSSVVVAKIINETTVLVTRN
jgi:hypothetical protein